jgi:hypothetical protein
MFIDGDMIYIEYIKGHKYESRKNYIGLLVLSMEGTPVAHVILSDLLLAIRDGWFYKMQQPLPAADGSYSNPAIEVYARRTDARD